VCLSFFKTEEAAVGRSQRCYTPRIIHWKLPKFNISFKFHSKNLEVSPNIFNINEHIPISYAYYIKCAFDSRLDKVVLETGKNSGVSFVNSLIKNLTELSDDYLHKIVPMRMILYDQQKFIIH